MAKVSLAARLGEREKIKKKEKKLPSVESPENIYLMKSVFCDRVMHFRQKNSTSR